MATLSCLQGTITQAGLAQTLRGQNSLVSGTRTQREGTERRLQTHCSLDWVLLNLPPYVRSAHCKRKPTRPALAHL